MLLSNKKFGMGLALLAALTTVGCYKHSLTSARVAILTLMRSTVVGNPIGSLE